jgi:hypothetical protein
MHATIGKVAGATRSEGMLSDGVAGPTRGDRDRMRPLWGLPGIVIVIATLLPACSAPRKPYACVIDAASPVVVSELWDCNREIMVRVVRGRKFTLREFSRASQFFETLTGIPADARAGSDGKLPGPALADDLDRWDAWYAANGARLVWDPDRGRIIDPL